MKSNLTKIAIFVLVVFSLVSCEKQKRQVIALKASIDVEKSLSKDEIKIKYFRKLENKRNTIPEFWEADDERQLGLLQKQYEEAYNIK